MVFLDKAIAKIELSGVKFLSSSGNLYLQYVLYETQFLQGHSYMFCGYAPKRLYSTIPSLHQRLIDSKG